MAPGASGKHKSIGRKHGRGKVIAAHKTWRSGT